MGTQKGRSGEVVSKHISYTKIEDYSECEIVPPTYFSFVGDARAIPLAAATVDLIVTSPPYWKKRDYGSDRQIGREKSLNDYVAELILCLNDWRRVLRQSGSIFLNLGDTFVNRSLAGVPTAFEVAARANRWIIRNRIIWVKEYGTPEAAKNRLANRHEYILHLVSRPDYFYDVIGYTERFGNWGNPGDVWMIKATRSKSKHLAPFPEEIVERAALLACPIAVCSNCGSPLTRLTERGTKLNPNRPQARRALELMREYNLKPEHIAAIQATGISDAGKAQSFQNGAGKNSAKVRELAKEAKAVLGGYFREFTFAMAETIGWRKCACNSPMMPGVILDPFVGTGTTMKAAQKLGRSAIGCDIIVPG